MKTKVSDKCGEEKPINEFGHDKSSPDGYKNVCKSCRAGCMRKIRGTITSERLSQVSSEELIKELQNRGYRGYFTFKMD